MSSNISSDSSSENDMMFNRLSLRNPENLSDKSMEIFVNFAINLDSSRTVAILIMSSLMADILDSSRGPECCLTAVCS